MNIVLSGYGKMGRQLEKIILEKGLPYAGSSEDIRHFDTALAKECVCVDFTTPQAFRENYPFIARHFGAAVVGTTGWNDILEDVLEAFRQNGTTLIYGSNFSIGVNLFYQIAQMASQCLSACGDYEPYILEMHHNQKLDAPSGTAKKLAQIVGNSYGTSVQTSSVRCGNIPGIHQIGFEGHDDRITLVHEAFSRKGLAMGALQAVQWCTLFPGIHEFQELVELQLQTVINHTQQHE